MPVQAPGPIHSRGFPYAITLLRGNRLQSTADVDAAGVAKLKEVLAKYEEILKLLK